MKRLSNMTKQRFIKSLLNKDNSFSKKGLSLLYDYIIEDEQNQSTDYVFDKDEILSEYAEYNENEIRQLISDDLIVYEEDYVDTFMDDILPGEILVDKLEVVACNNKIFICREI